MGQPADQPSEVGVAGGVLGVDQGSIQGVEPDAGATSSAEPGGLAEVIGVEVGGDDGVEGRDGDAECGEVASSVSTQEGMSMPESSRA
jgi:hypothetical protein